MQTASNGTATPYKKRYTKEDNAPDLSAYVFGRQQPQATPLEEAVLGALLLDREIFDIVGDLLTPKTFYLEKHQEVYRAIVSLKNQGHPVDILTVTEEMRRLGNLDKVQGGYYLVELTHRVASAANCEYHSRILQQKFLARALIEICTRSIRESYDDTEDIFTVLDRLETALSGIRIWEGRQEQNMATLGALFLKDLEQRSKAPDGLVGVPTGLIDLDRKTGGWQGSDLIIIAARPGMGKSAMAYSMAKNAAEMGKPIGIITPEMTSLQVYYRMAAQVSEIDSERLRKGTLTESEWQQIQTAVEKLMTLPIYFDETPGINILDLKSKARQWVKKYGIMALYVDYLQLITTTVENGKVGNRDGEVGLISRSLKNLAKELNIPVIALSQLSRAVETRGGSKRPILSDLRESGNIEQEADVVAFIYRPEYYKILEDENGQSLKGIAEIILAKHRHGALDAVKVRYISEFTQFLDLDNFNLPPAVSGSTLQQPKKKAAPGTAPSPDKFTMPARMNEEDIPF